MPVLHSLQQHLWESGMHPCGLQYLHDCTNLQFSVEMSYIHPGYTVYRAVPAEHASHLHIMIRSREAPCATTRC